MSLSYQRFPRDLNHRFEHLGVRYILARHRRRLPRPWRAVFNGTGGRVWENPDALPLFFVPAAAERVREPLEALERTLANPDFRASSVIQASGPGTAQEGTVRIGRVWGNGFDLEVESRTGGLIASSVSHSAGWRLNRDGEEGRVLRVNAGFVGFEVPPGRHQVVLEYRPAGWTWGLRLFALGLVGVLVAALRSRGRLLRPQDLDGAPLEGAGAGGQSGEHGQ